MTTIDDLYHALVVQVDFPLDHESAAARPVGGSGRTERQH